MCDSVIVWGRPRSVSICFNRLFSPSGMFVRSSMWNMATITYMPDWMWHQYALCGSKLSSWVKFS